MGIILTGEPGIRYPRKSLIKTATRVLSILGCDDRSLSVVLVKGKTIQKLNKAYRRRDKQTDVLSFSTPSEIAKISGYIGEIFICVDVAKKNAKEDGHSLEKEITVLLVHGILHLTGHDHSAKMFSLQKKIIKEVC